MLDVCIQWFVSVFGGFFTWLNSWFILPGVSYLTFIVGAFLVFVFIDNFLMKGK